MSSVTYFDDQVGGPRQLHQHDDRLAGLPVALSELLAHLTEDGKDALLSEIEDAAVSRDKSELAQVLKAWLRSYAFARDAEGFSLLVDRLETPVNESDDEQAYTLRQALLPR
ncbi:MAG TPA: hypothetical protein VGA36_08945 [Nitriliruptorales bacterium]